jgi:hypothetical protein
MHARTQRCALSRGRSNSRGHGHSVPPLNRRAGSRLPALRSAKLRRLEFHYVPKHACWLNMAEIESGVRRGQCLDGCIATPMKSMPRGSFWANGVFFATGAPAYNLDLAASWLSRPRAVHREVRRVPGLAEQSKIGGKLIFGPPYHPTSQCGFWAARQFPPEKKFSPKLSFGAADSSRKSAKRRRSGLS